MNQPVYGVVESTCTYKLKVLAKIIGFKDPRTVEKFLKKHGYRPAIPAQGDKEVSGYVWNLCIQREMMEGDDDEEVDQC